MTRGGAAVLLVLALVAGLFLWLVEPRLERQVPPGSGGARVMPAFSSAEVERIAVVAGDDAFEISRKGDGWRVGPSPKDRASRQEVETLLAAIAELEGTDIIRPDELRDRGGLREIGLWEPRSRIEIEFGSGRKEILFFGKEAVVEGRLYVRRDGSDPIYIVPETVQRLAFRSIDEFRDRRLTDLVPAQITRFVLKRRGGEMELERGPVGWEFVRPFRARADAEKVERFLSPVLGAAILEFVADQTYDLSGHAPGEARAELVLFAAGEKRAQALRVGPDLQTPAPPVGESPDDEPRLVAQFTGRDAVYHLPGRLWGHLAVTPDDLRDRRLLALNLDTVDAIRVTRDGRRAELRRAPAGGWTVRREGGPPDGEPVEAGAVESWVDSLRRAEVSRYIPATPVSLAEHGLVDAPRVIAFDAWLSENTPESTAGRHPVASLAIGTTADGSAFVRVGEAPEISVVPDSATGEPGWIFGSP